MLRLRLRLPPRRRFREVRPQALHYLATHNTLTVATAGPTGPWAAALFYVNDAFVLYWLSDPASRHSLNVAHNPHAAITIHEDYRDWRVIQGLQMEGTVEQLGPPRSVEGPMQMYAAKYPFLGDRRHPRPALAPALESARVYRFTPSRVLFLDNTRGFGRRDELDPRG
jgi:uncharacterized protein